MALPEVKVVPAPSGCVVFVQRPAVVAVQNRLLYMGYTLEELDGSGVPDGFKGMVVHSAEGVGPTLAELTRLLQVEPYWVVRTTGVE